MLTSMTACNGTVPVFGRSGCRHSCHDQCCPLDITHLQVMQEVYCHCPH